MFSVEITVPLFAGAKYAYNSTKFSGKSRNHRHFFTHEERGTLVLKMMWEFKLNSSFVTNHSTRLLKRVQLLSCPCSLAAVDANEFLPFIFIDDTIFVDIQHIKGGSQILDLKVHELINC